MEVSGTAIRDVLAGPDVVVVLVLITVFSSMAFLIPFPPVQIPSYLLAVSFGSGAVTVGAWYLIAVIAGAISRRLRTRFGKPEWDSLGAAVFPLATGIAVVGVVVIGLGFRPMILPIETVVTACTPSGCETQTELITDPNLSAVGTGIGLLVIGTILLVFQSPLVANGQDHSHS